MLAEKILSYRQYLRQRPVMLALLTGFTLLFILGVTGLSRAYQAQRQALGNRWYARGVSDLNAKHFDAAVTEFRAALLYARDDYNYQLNLAEALIGAKQTGQASAYLLNLWDREPENGQVNLELARIAAQKGQNTDAVRYFNDAVYAAWPPDQEAQRREARVELIGLFLRTNAKTQAQAELIALAENVGDDPAEQARIGDLFVRAGDYQDALEAYRLSLKYDRHDAATLKGAGEAAFELGQYPVAEHYLEMAIAEDPNDAQAAERLKTAQMIVRMDPFRNEISSEERNRVIVEAFTTAGERVSHCPVPNNAGAVSAGSPPVSPANVSEEWSALKSRVTERELRRDPDLGQRAMDLVFRIERQTSAQCGMPSGADLALLLIAKEHEGT
ncbi:MAG TPA: tetratricopeptide repeat protein [Candidatus Binatia bacterium]|nr:tetratricopeptide repeat protein [Candidatus Binatia bacterium]